MLFDHDDPDASTLNNSISEVDRLQVLHASINKRERRILNNLSTTVDHSKEIVNLFCTLEAEINKKIISSMSPSKILTKRQHSFLSSQNKKIQNRRQRHSTKDKPQFQRVGQVRKKSRNSMDKQMELISSKDYRNVKQTSDHVQHYVPDNIGIVIRDFNLFYII
jgi:hypothetical protein